MVSFNGITTALSALFAVGVVMAFRTYLFVKRGRAVQAKVVSIVDATVHNPETGSQSASVDRLVVEMPMPSNRKRIVPLADAVGGAIAEKLVGQDGTISVIYDPKRPEIVRINSLLTLFFVPAFLCAPGILFLFCIAYVMSIS